MITKYGKHIMTNSVCIICDMCGKRIFIKNIRGRDDFIYHVFRNYLYNRSYIVIT